MKPAHQRIFICLSVLFFIGLSIPNYFISEHIVISINNDWADSPLSSKILFYGILCNILCYCFEILFILLIQLKIACIRWMFMGEFYINDLEDLFESLYIYDWEKIKRKQVKLDIKSKEARERGQLSLSD